MIYCIFHTGKRRKNETSVCELVLVLGYSMYMWNSLHRLF